MASTSFVIVYATSSAPAQHKYVYPIPYTCASDASKAYSVLGLAPATYSTSISMSNPGYSTTVAPFTYLMYSYQGIAPPATGTGLLGPLTSTASGVSIFVMNCGGIEYSIYGTAHPSAPDEGWFYIYTNVKLDVAVTYTANSTTGISMSTQIIQPTTYVP